MVVPLLVAHRGYASRFPENTLEGLEAALVAGACFVEFDVQLTADGVAVLLHDADLVRTAGQADRVTELTAAELTQIDLLPARGSHAPTTCSVPTLADAGALLARWPRARAFVELKPEGLRRFGVDRVLDRITIDLAPVAARCIPISSVVAALAPARQRLSGPIGMVLREWSSAAHRQLIDLAPEYVFCNVERLPADSELWRGPWQWVIYEIVDPDLALELAARGAGLIETMAIGEMLDHSVLGTRGCRG